MTGVHTHKNPILSQKEEFFQGKMKETLFYIVKQKSQQILPDWTTAPKTDESPLQL